MVLALSMTSSQALLAIFDDEAATLLSSRKWNNLGGLELGEHLADKFSEIQKEMGSQFKLTKIFGVEGPGSFTGLRVSSAFLKGLSSALGLEMLGISSYDLFDEAFAFSLRPAKAAELTLEECIERDYKFIEVDKSGVKIVNRPQTQKVLGLKASPFWPSLEELQAGVKRSLHKKTFDLNYGYTPEFVKQIV